MQAGEGGRLSPEEETILAGHAKRQSLQPAVHATLPGEFVKALPYCSHRICMPSAHQSLQQPAPLHTAR